MAAANQQWRNIAAWGAFASSRRNQSNGGGISVSWRNEREIKAKKKSKRKRRK